MILYSEYSVKLWNNRMKVEYFSFWEENELTRK